MSKAEKITNRICGYSGLALAIIPILKIIPIPWFQALVSAIDPIVATTAGTLGCGLLISSDKLVGK